MRKLLFFLLTIVYLFCSGCGKTSTNEIPMYGGIEFTPEQKEINEKFIQGVVKQYGSREAAADESVRCGWHYYNEKHDLKTAMKRFNQAWLLDPNNAGAFFGFGFLMAEKGKEDEAITYYKKSIELDPTYPWAHNLLGSALILQGMKEEGIIHINKAIELEPTNQVFQQNLKYYEKNEKK